MKKFRFSLLENFQNPIITVRVIPNKFHNCVRVSRGHRASECSIGMLCCYVYVVCFFYILNT